MIGNWGDRLQNPLALLRQRMHDEHPRVRLEAIVACSHISVPQSIEVAAMAVYLASEDARGVTGQAFTISCGSVQA